MSATGKSRSTIDLSAVRIDPVIDSSLTSLAEGIEVLRDPSLTAEQAAVLDILAETVDVLRHVITLQAKERGQ